MIFDVVGHFEAGNKIGTGPANYTDVKKVPPDTFLQVTGTPNWVTQICHYVNIIDLEKGADTGGYINKQKSMN